MFKILIPAVAALGLVAFAAQTATPSSQVEDVTSVPASLAMAQPVMSWSLHHEGAIAKLAYGVENSDQLALMMTCMPGDASAIVYGDVQPQGARLIHTSGPAALDPLSGGEAEESRISIRDASLRGLAGSGEINMTGDAGMFRVTASRQEQRVIGDFLAYCAGTRV